MSDAVARFAEKGCWADAAEAQKELLAFVGNREIEDADLRSAMARADTAGQSAKQRLYELQQADERQRQEQKLLAARKEREAKALQNLRSLELQANAFLANGDFDRAIERYQQALESANQNQAGIPELTRVVAQITREQEEAKKGRLQSRVNVLEKHAAALVAQGDPEAALREYEMAIKIMESSPFASDLLTNIARLRATKRSVDEQAKRQDAMKRAMVAAGKKMSTFYAEGFARVLRDMAGVQRAAVAEYDTDQRLVLSYEEAYQELLATAVKTVKNIPYFAKEEKLLLGPVWVSLERADTALATRISCAMNYYRYGATLLRQGIRGGSPEKVRGIASLFAQAVQQAGKYQTEAEQNHRYLSNLLEQGILDDWHTRLEKEGLTTDAEAIKLAASKIMKELQQKEEQLERDSRRPVAVVCPRCGGTGRKSEREIQMEISARSASTVGTGRTVRVKIDPACPRCEGRGKLMVSP